MCPCRYPKKSAHHLLYIANSTASGFLRMSTQADCQEFFKVSSKVISCGQFRACQRAATHRPTLQRTAKHCNTQESHLIQTISCAATHCSTLHKLRHTATHRKVISYRLFRVLQHTATPCNTLKRTATHCNTQHTATHSKVIVCGQFRMPTFKTRRGIQGGDDP